ncbi:MAG: hypothetical protein RLZZ226_455 [Pseudomonadota bacterium]
MNEKIKITELSDFDITEYLDSDAAIAEYLTIVLEDGDSVLLTAALGDIARARGMNDIAQASGLTHDALYNIPARDSTSSAKYARRWV